MIQLLIKNGFIIDGTNSKGYIADIAVNDGKIVQIDKSINIEAVTTIDANNKIVSPGFIDAHRHSDAFAFKDNYGEIQIRQGITTTINGNCGLSVVPCPNKWKDEIYSYLSPIIGSVPKDINFETFSEYLDELEKLNLPINFGMHVGNGTLRMAVNGFNKGELTDEQYGNLHIFLNDAINSGAFGVSMGIVYMPENMYDFNGIIKALEPIRNKNIPLVTHIRGEGDLLVTSLKEVISIAKELNVPLHISHYKCVGPHNWGHLLNKATEVINEAQNEGMKITADIYPWTAGSTQLVQLLPPEFLEGGHEKTIERLKNPIKRATCKNILENKQEYFENLLYSVGWHSIMITTVQTEKNQQFIGKKVSEIAEELGKDPYDVAFDLLIEEDLNISMVNFIVCEEDIETILKYPFTSIISDSIYPDGGLPHPRQIGTHAKVLQEYVKEKNILNLEEAIYKMTYFPAKIFGIENKGRIKEGYDADLLIFDLDNIENHANYINPTISPTGFDYVFLSGELTNKSDTFINTGLGKVLRHKL
ncbi:N-acyl-D-amino-acid deacylase family protein [Miniphocaeibacter massiliensis]|uniref:N-acyl-D-amino-acid deacylase family protein n=1 Tax=Miniphocaeibacter massiliensis TaxID=2041841 RepID=UPI000C1C32EF|nr:amidohydrolase family protein [Miniphocaeibacter massiliensis]